jgi:hypothetical protein
MTIAVITIWPNLSERDLIASALTALGNEMASNNKTDGKIERTTPSTSRRVFVDEAAADEFISACNELCVKNNLVVPTFKKQ